MIKRALISVSDKAGLADVARRLHQKNIRIIATSGTAKILTEEGIPVTSIEEVTKFPECFSGRLKTLHPKIVGGILLRRARETVSRGDEVALRDEEEAEKLGIEPIDLVIVNLYPFQEVKESKESEESEEAMVELIDIGGPALLRSAAKNYESVTVVCDPSDYERVLLEIEKSGDTTPALRKALAAKVFLRMAAYDAAIAEHLSGGENAGVILADGRNLRYGENPHQWGRVFAAVSSWQLAVSKNKAGIANAEVLQGKEMSYLNYLDADAAWQCVLEFEEPTVVFLKHASPCGVASNSNILDAFRRGYDSDPRSAFGVVIALNRECPVEVIREILERKIFVELLLAPSFSEEALQRLREKPAIRVLKVSDGEVLEFPEIRSISGGVLLQEPDRKVLTDRDLKVVTKKKPSQEQMADLLFAARVVKHVKSNAIVLAHDRVTVGIGPGQTSRVDAVEIAVRKAGSKAKGSTPKQTPAASLQGTVMASDAFFPFPDSVEEAAQHGIAAIIQPGGSIRDAEVIAKADTLGIAMVVTGVRAFRH